MIDDYITNYFAMYMKNQFDKIKFPRTYGENLMARYRGRDSSQKYMKKVLYKN